jgi:hypothetical protein
MLTDRTSVNSASPWNLDWVGKSPLFSPLRAVAKHLPQNGWPDANALTEMAEACGARPANVHGQPVRFVVQAGKPVRFEEKFEPRTYLRGEVMVRESNWHDLFNALVWMTFPAAKANINRRHYEALKAQAGRQRSPEGDALTMFDEDGVVVLSADRELLDLLLRFRWKELFWEHRQRVRTEMRFLVFGHAMYEKALHPYVGLTAKSVLLHVPRAMLALEDGALATGLDKRLATYIRDPLHFQCGRSLAPLPVLGIPGWWPDNECADFYDDTSYFRPGRSGTDAPDSSSIS